MNDQRLGWLPISGIRLARHTRPFIIGRPDPGENAVTNPTNAPLPASLLEQLARYDTPTICNALEIVAPARRLVGYTTKPLVCPFPDLLPIVGYARTVTIRSVVASALPATEQQKRRTAYYE